MAVGVFRARHREHDPIFGRHDAAVDFISAMWKDSLKFMEPNMTGIGGMHMVPMADQILASIVFPASTSKIRSCISKSAATFANC